MYKLVLIHPSAPSTFKFSEAEEIWNKKEEMVELLKQIETIKKSCKIDALSKELESFFSVVENFLKMNILKLKLESVGKQGSAKEEENEIVLNLMKAHRKLEKLVIPIRPANVLSQQFKKISTVFFDLKMQ